MVTVNEIHGFIMFSKGQAEVNIEESKLNWYVTIRPLKYELPVTVRWKITKKEAKTANAAALAAYNIYAARPYCVVKW